jgi:hypothetical protein
LPTAILKVTKSILVDYRNLRCHVKRHVKEGTQRETGTP